MAVLDLTFPKMVKANTVKFSCFYNERKEWLRNMYHVTHHQIGLVEDNPTIALMLSAHISYQ